MDEQLCKPTEAPQSPFSKETIESLKDLGETLQRIHNRLILEGYVIKDGQIYKPEK